MASLADIRAKYPEYGYLDDDELAGALHSKFYSDMPREEFDKRVGLSKTPAQPEMTAGEVAGDVAKSAGIGLVQGGIGLATTPGNLEALGRAGINAAAGLVGAQPPVSSETYLPTYSDWKGRVEDVTGEFYKPKTTIGEYARTVGEFAPFVIGGPAGVANRAARVALPAVVSETAGQATEGTALEPWARMAGAFAGGMLPNTAARAVTPAPANPGRANAVQTLEREGVTALTAGQRTGSKRLRWVEDATSMVPGGGGRATTMQNQANEQFTRAALRKAGVDGSRADADTMAAAFRNIGLEFDDLAARNNMVQFPKFRNDLLAAKASYDSLVPPMMRSPVIEEVITEMTKAGASMRGIMPGDRFQVVRSRLGEMIPGADPQTGQALRKIRDAMDDAMEESIRRWNKSDLGQWQNVRGRYRNLLAIEDALAGAGEAAASGVITPSALRTAVKKQGKRAYVTGKGDLGSLARAGEEVLKPLASSGTAERNFAQGVVGAPAVIGSGIGGVLSAGDPMMMLAGAIAPPLIKAATARGLMSGPMQRYFANQRIPHNVEPVNWMRTAPFAAAQFEGTENPLRGGIGPRYDENGNAMRGY